MQLQRDEKKIVETLMAKPDGIAKTSELAGFSSGAQMLNALRPLESRKLVSYVDPIVTLTTYGFEFFGHPTFKNTRSLKEREDDLLKTIASGDGAQVVLMSLDSRDLGILRDLEAKGLIVKLMLTLDGTGSYRITSSGLTSYSARTNAGSSEAKAAHVQSDREEPNWFDKAKSSWPYGVFALLLVAIITIYPILNPQQFCPRLPEGLATWLERCSQETQQGTLP